MHSANTARGNLVAVITNGTAVLGLGNIGPLAAKPVMEGKGVLFKKFAGIDVFDIEVNENDPDKLIDIIAALEPTFGGINLEDIKAPECFYIERKLRERMKIPVFHDDQHGTAIIVGAAILNGLKIVGKDLKKCKLVVSGAGAAALACLDLIVDLGFPIENIFVTDLAGVVYKGRKELMDPDKERFARETSARTLAEVMPEADIFLGLSAGGVLKPEMVKAMAAKPLVLALANPTPEILPEEVAAVRGDAVMATGRSDYPNQVNNVLCFPYIFRGALDCGAHHDHARDGNRDRPRDRRSGASRAIRYRRHHLRHHQSVLRSGKSHPQAVRSAADHRAGAGGGQGGGKIRRGVAPDQGHGCVSRPPAAIRLPQRHLQETDFPGGQGCAAGEETHRKLCRGRGRASAARRAGGSRRATGALHPGGTPRRCWMQRIAHFGLRLKPRTSISPSSIPNMTSATATIGRPILKSPSAKGVTEQYAKLEMRRRHSLIGAMMIHKGHADGMICGTFGNTILHLHYIDQVLGRREGVNVYAAMNGVILPDRQLVMVDTHVNDNPTAEQLAEITILQPAEEMKRFRPGAACGAAVAFELRLVEQQVKPRRCARDIGNPCKTWRPIWKSKARCMAMPRSTISQRC